MPSKVREVLFSEPTGRPTNRVQFAGALVFTCLYVYFGVVRGAGSSSWLLVMMVGAGLSGTAESLPDARRRTAGVLRLTAVLVLVALVAATVFAPDLVVG